MKLKTALSKPNYTEKYKASSTLILHGGFKNIIEAKCYHGLLVLASFRGWKYDTKGEMRIGIGELHRLTRHTCSDWSEYLTVLRRIKDTAKLDWGHLSRVVGGFNRIGDVNILSEVRADLDLAGQFQEIVFRIPAALLEDVIKPKWFGQVNPEILFSIKSNYAFNAYLFACLTVIEKDTTKDIFFSDAKPLAEWAAILGADEMPTWRFKQDIFKRTEKQIEKATQNTDEPIEIIFTDEHTSRRGLYQMVVKRVKRIETAKPSPAEALAVAHEAKRAEELKKIDAEFAAMMRRVEAHPQAGEIKKEMKGQNSFALYQALDRMSIDSAFLIIES